MMDLKDREKFIDRQSTGSLSIGQLYTNKGKIRKTDKKKNIPINIKINKIDLEIIDHLAEKFEISRNLLIASIIECDVEQMFSTFETKPRYQLARAADDEITRKNLPHEYRGATWYWDVVGPSHEVFHPDEKGLKE